MINCINYNSKIMIPPDTNVIVRYGDPIDNSIDPTMAPKSLQY